MSRKKKNGTETPVGSVVPGFLQDVIMQRFDDAATREKWPTLYSSLAPVHEGATLRRQAGRITFKVIGHNLVCTLSNPTEIIDIDICVTSLTTAFDEVELALTSGTATFKPGWQKNRKKPPTILDDLVQ